MQRLEEFLGRGDVRACSRHPVRREDSRLEHERCAMVNNYKILRKAQLADDLFAPADDAAAWEQDQADREWAQEMDGKPDGPRAPQPPAALLPAREEVAAIALEAEAPQVSTLIGAPSRRHWTQVLADLTGNPVLEGIRTLGVCALEGKKGASLATAALAQWMAHNSETPTLAVEAHFRESTLARAFRVREEGVTDSLLHNRSIDSLVQETGEANLNLIAGGSLVTKRDKKAVVRGFPALFSNLRERFPAIVVELPALDDPTFDSLPIASIADAVILVADSKTALPRQLRRAADKLREAQAPLAATLLDATQMISAQLRHHRLAQQLQRAEASPAGPRLTP